MTQEKSPHPSRRPNRLIYEKSPYLRQHAYNPVDWYPWGPEALEKARREDKPIFLSIGYAACHWCHVMEQESFNDPEIADVLNRLFVPIKVDREERPDIDQIYMQAVMTMMGHGGWPLNVFLTPELKPFYGGTYFPPEDRWGQPGFRRVLQAVAQVWREQRAEVEKTAAHLTEALKAAFTSLAATRPPRSDIRDVLVEQLRRAFDADFGGFGPAPKFPPHAQLRYLLRYAFRTGSADVLTMVEKTLQAMAYGGIYDQLGGGFHRYSVDASWRVPHFEKMLYDNAQLAVVYTEAFLATRHPLYRRVVTETLDYLLRDMSSPEGAFYSAEDADSEGREGAFYTWTYDAIVDILGHNLGEAFARQFGVTREGNFERGENVLYVACPFATVAAEVGLSLDTWMESIDRAREQLLGIRQQRPRPLRDEKILADWNGLTLSALAIAGFALDEPRYTEAARRLADWLMKTLWDSDRQILYHRYMEGERAIPGMLADYTYVTQGLIDLYEVTGIARYLQAALQLTDRAVDIFWDPQNGAFFDTDPHQPDLITPVKETFDGATPAGNSVALGNLYRLFEITGIERYRDYADTVVQVFAQVIEHHPPGMAYMVMAWDFALEHPYEIVLVGTSERLRKARASLHTLWFPYKTLVWQDPSHPIDYPALRDKVTHDGGLTIYVCRNFTCQAPLHDVSALVEFLKADFPQPRR